MFGNKLYLNVIDQWPKFTLWSKVKLKKLASELCPSVRGESNPTAACYNATGSLAHFENKNIFFHVEKRSTYLVYLQIQKS
jgi:hypothetical protein